MSANISASAFHPQPQAAAAGGGTTTTTTTTNARAANRQTRTNPSRTSKTVGRTSFAFGHHRGSIAESTATAATAAGQLPHGFYPALTHFTDAITALPREFRRHNSLLKEVDAKAWALEENLLQLLEVASESRAVQYPATPAPIVAGVVREDFLPRDLGQPPESHESKNRRLLFDRLRYTLSDLMLTADEKNHVITNANDELDRQLQRLDSIFPYIAGEISDESRLGSLTHWAYSNKELAKAAANERPRREVASNKQDLAQALHEAEAASRSEARREAVQARKQRRAHIESDFDEVRVPGSRKTGAGKSRGGEHAGTGDQPTTTGGVTAAPAKRRKVERAAQPAEGGVAMERKISTTGAAGGRAVSKETGGSDATKKRVRAPNAGTTAARKRNNTGATVDSALGASSPVVGTFTVPRAAASPGPNATARPSSSRTQHNPLQGTNARQRPSSSASNRMTNNNKTTDPDRKSAAKDGSTIKADGAASLSKPPTPHSETAPEHPQPGVSNGVGETGKREDSDSRPEHNPSEPAVDSGSQPPQTAVSSTNPPAKGRSSKTSTPVLGTIEMAQPRVRQTRNGVESAVPTTAMTTTAITSAITNPTTTTSTTNASKRTQKKAGSTSTATTTTGISSKLSVPALPSEDEESYLEGDDEDDEGEPRYCYCNGVSFGDMIACDNDACPREWFHLECLKMSKPPAKNVKWYCNECKENMNIGGSVKRGRNGR